MNILDDLQGKHGWDITTASNGTRFLKTKGLTFWENEDWITIKKGYSVLSIDDAKAHLDNTSSSATSEDDIREALL